MFPACLIIALCFVLCAIELFNVEDISCWINVKLNFIIILVRHLWNAACENKNDNAVLLSGYFDITSPSIV